MKETTVNKDGIVKGHTDGQTIFFWETERECPPYIGRICLTSERLIVFDVRRSFGGVNLVHTTAWETPAIAQLAPLNAVHDTDATIAFASSPNTSLGHKTSNSITSGQSLFWYIQPETLQATKADDLWTTVCALQIYATISDTQTCRFFWQALIGSFQEN